MNIFYCHTRVPKKFSAQFTFENLIRQRTYRIREFLLSTNYMILSSWSVEEEIKKKHDDWLVDPNFRKWAVPRNFQHALCKNTIYL